MKNNNQLTLFEAIEKNFYLIEINMKKLIVLREIMKGFSPIAEEEELRIIKSLIKKREDQIIELFTELPTS